MSNFAELNDTISKIAGLSGGLYSVGNSAATFNPNDPMSVLSTASSITSLFTSATELISTNSAVLAAANGLNYQAAVNSYYAAQDAYKTAIGHNDFMGAVSAYLNEVSACSSGSAPTPP